MTGFTRRLQGPVPAAPRCERAQEAYYTGRRGRKRRGLRITDLLGKYRILRKSSGWRVLRYVRNAMWKVQSGKNKGCPRTVRDNGGGIKLASAEKKKKAGG